MTPEPTPLRRCASAPHEPAAATLLVLLTRACTLTPMRFLGIGMIIAQDVDTTLVRMLLVTLMGRSHWWLTGDGRVPRASVRVVEQERTPTPENARSRVSAFRWNRFLGACVSMIRRH